MPALDILVPKRQGLIFSNTFIGKELARMSQTTANPARCAVPMYNAHRKDYQPLQPIPVVHTPWTKLVIDIVGPLNTTRRGHKYHLTMVDLATRWPEAIPLKKIDAVSTSEALLNIFSTYVVPQLLVYDNGHCEIHQPSDENHGYTPDKNDTISPRSKWAY